MSIVFISCDDQSIWVASNDTIICDYGFQTHSIQDLQSLIVDSTTNPFDLLNYDSADALLGASITLFATAFILKIVINFILRSTRNE